MWYFIQSNHLQVDPGLAILPIVAILCGVAIGLGTVALGVILMIRGRTPPGDDFGDLASGDEASIKRYDAVCTTTDSTSSTEDLRSQHGKAPPGGEPHHNQQRYRGGIPSGRIKPWILHDSSSWGHLTNCSGFWRSSGCLRPFEEIHYEPFFQI